MEEESARYRCVGDDGSPLIVVEYRHVGQLDTDAGPRVSVRRALFLTAYGVATSIRFGSRAERSKLPKPQP